MICPVEIARDLCAFRAARVRENAKHVLVHEGSSGAGDESPGSDFLRAMAKRITWWQAAEIIGISDRQMRRWRERYEEFGYDGLFERRQGKPSPKRVPVARVEQVLGLYRERNFDVNVRQFPDNLRHYHQTALSSP